MQNKKYTTINTISSSHSANSLSNNSVRPNKKVIIRNVNGEHMGENRII